MMPQQSRARLSSYSTSHHIHYLFLYAPSLRLRIRAQKLALLRNRGNAQRIQGSTLFRCPLRGREGPFSVLLDKVLTSCYSGKQACHGSCFKHHCAGRNQKFIDVGQFQQSFSKNWNGLRPRRAVDPTGDLSGFASASRLHSSIGRVIGIYSYAVCHETKWTASNLCVVTSSGRR